MIIYRLFSILCLLLIFNEFVFSNWLAPNGKAHTNAEKAETFYILGNTKEMSQALWSFLEENPTDIVSRQFAHELLDKAYAHNRGKLASPWSLPSDLKNASLRWIYVLRPNGKSFGLTFWVKMPASDTIKQLQITLVGGATLLDLKGSIGESTITAESEGGYSLDLSREIDPNSLTSSSYKIFVELKDGTKAEVFVIADTMISTATPFFQSPVGQQVPAGEMQIKWSDFHSPFWKNYEKRRFRFYLSQMSGNKWSAVWSHESFFETAVKTTPQQAGKYWLSLAVSEEKNFSDILLCRVSRFVQPIQVGK